MNNNVYPLSYPQKTIWYMEKLYKNSSMSNVCGTVRLKVGVDFELLNKAINTFIKQHDAMRIKIIEENGSPVQFIKEQQDLKFDFVDFSNKSKEEFYLWEESESRNPINIFEDNLFKFIMIKFSEQEGGFLIKINHVIGDAWSMMLLTSEIKDI